MGSGFSGALARMEEIATQMPGYTSHKGDKADDGERLTLFGWGRIRTARGDRNSFSLR